MSINKKIIHLILLAMALSGCYKSGAPAEDSEDYNTDSIWDSNGDSLDTFDTSSDEDPSSDTQIECIPKTEQWVVDRVFSISQIQNQFVTITLVNDGKLFLKIDTALTEHWLDMITHVMEQNGHVSFFIDWQDLTIVDLEIPLTSPVESLTENDEGVYVMLRYSAAVHMLYRTSPCFYEFLKILQNALTQKTEIVLTETMEDGIVDIRPPRPNYR